MRGYVVHNINNRGGSDSHSIRNVEEFINYYPLSGVVRYGLEIEWAIMIDNNTGDMVYKYTKDKGPYPVIVTNASKLYKTSGTLRDE